MRGGVVLRGARGAGQDLGGRSGMGMRGTPVPGSRMQPAGKESCLRTRLLGSLLLVTLVVTTLLSLASPARADSIHFNVTGWRWSGGWPSYDPTTKLYFQPMWGWFEDQDPSQAGTQVLVTISKPAVMMEFWYWTERAGGRWTLGYQGGMYTPSGQRPQASPYPQFISAGGHVYDYSLTRQAADAAAIYATGYWKIWYKDGTTAIARGTPAGDAAGARPQDPIRSESVDPRQYLASLCFDGTDGGEHWGEESFPVRGDNGHLINTYEPYGHRNADWTGKIDDALPENSGRCDVEDAAETYVPHQITAAAEGMSYDRVQEILGHASIQTPAVYFHRVDLSVVPCEKCGKLHPGWEVWQYWVYYAVNSTHYASYPAHEHDWESYWVYVWNGRPYAVQLSAHHSGGQYYLWSEMTGSEYEASDSTHLNLNIEGTDNWYAVDKGKAGSHAFIGPDYAGYHDSGVQDGVRITWDGRIQLGPLGRLEQGACQSHPWTVFTSDPEACWGSTLPFDPLLTQSYYRGDYEIQRKNVLPCDPDLWYTFFGEPRELQESQGDMDPPWERDEWKGWCWTCASGKPQP